MSCHNAGSEYIERRVRAEDAIAGGWIIEIEKTSCQGKCREAPCVILDGIQYTKTNPAKIAAEIQKKQNKSL